MSTTITVNPITRISGFMQIEVTIDKHKIIDAKSSGLMYRGFEKMLVERPPLDAIFFTERICGICSAAHSIVSARALEDALKVHLIQNNLYLREIIHGFEILQNHLRHFYFFMLPDFIVTPNISPISSAGGYDLRLPDKLNKKISEDYLEAAIVSRLAHQGEAVIGGKAPHNHGIFVGGVTEKLDSYRLLECKALIQRIKNFVVDKMLEDIGIISEYYKDYFNMGKGYGNLLSFGLFDKFSEDKLKYVDGKILINNKIEDFKPDLISENIYSSWYDGENIYNDMYREANESNVNKEEAYSFIKAPRYMDYAMEGGPLARMILSGNYENKVSMMDRDMARVKESIKVCETMEALLDRIKPLELNLKQYSFPEDVRGNGFCDTTRGPLAHFLEVKDQKIKHYNIITPSAWNCSPMDSKGVKGVVEKALIGTEIQNINEPVEIGRIVRSFDPCISCATHVISDSNKPLDIIICN